jgi:hypothetical protein
VALVGGLFGIHASRLAGSRAHPQGSSPLLGVVVPGLPQDLATDAVREGEGGCLFDEIQDLVEPTERLHMEVQAGPQRGRMPERRGQSRASDSPVSGEHRGESHGTSATTGKWWLVRKRSRIA